MAELGIRNAAVVGSIPTSSSTEKGLVNPVLFLWNMITGEPTTFSHTIKVGSYPGV